MAVKVRSGLVLIREREEEKKKNFIELRIAMTPHFMKTMYLLTDIRYGNIR
jgi:hypothetical protein